jgi:hypothetical protein
MHVIRRLLTSTVTFNKINFISEAEGSIQNKKKLIESQNSLVVKLSLCSNLTHRWHIHQNSHKHNPRSTLLCM